jgi:hypothetical protein
MSKASLDIVSAAIDALPESKNALMSIEGRIAYRAATDKILYSMGWTYDEFIEVLSRRILEKEKQ